MKTKLLALLIAIAFSSTAFAIGGDIAIGPFFGMSIPIVNKDIKSGSTFGIQARFAPLSFVAVGAHYQSRKFGDPSKNFFYGSDTKDGGSASSIGFDGYLGKTSGTGVNIYLMGSIGSYSWTRDNQAKVSKTAYAVGPGVEIVLPLPVKIGLEGKALMEIVPTGNSGSWKNFVWTIGANYHFGLGPM
jgi:opacity protein-like surface antigen